MPDLTSPGGDLDPIERASADELRALQLERLRWTLRHAYANVAHYRAAFDAAEMWPFAGRRVSLIRGSAASSDSAARVPSASEASSARQSSHREYTC